MYKCTMYTVQCTVICSIGGGGGGLHGKSYVDKSENVRESAIYNQYIYVWMIYTWIFKNIKLSWFVFLRVRVAWYVCHVTNVIECEGE